MSVRLGGQCLLIGGIGSILSSLLVFLIPGPVGISGPGSIPANVVMILSGLFLLVGVPALYRAQARQVGTLGLVGTVFLWVAIILGWLVLSSVEILDVAMPSSIPHPGGEGPPPLALIPAILGELCFLIGGLIVGIKTIRAHVFPAAVGWVILIAAALLIPGTIAGNGNLMLDVIFMSSEIALMCVGLAWAGAALSFQRVTPRVA
jgi:hypothetical protein